MTKKAKKTAPRRVVVMIEMESTRPLVTLRDPKCWWRHGCVIEQVQANVIRIRK